MQFFPHDVYSGKGLWNGCYILFESLLFGILNGDDFVVIGGLEGRLWREKRVREAAFLLNFSYCYEYFS